MFMGQIFSEMMTDVLNIYISTQIKRLISSKFQAFAIFITSTLDSSYPTSHSRYSINALSISGALFTVLDRKTCIIELITMSSHRSISQPRHHKQIEDTTLKW
jgi:hypothetical protein